MTILALGSIKGSPGVTTAVLALAAVWPRDRALLVVEADADGGDLAARLGLHPEPGVSTLAAAARHLLSDEVIAEHAQRLPGGVPVLIAPPDGDEVGRALEGLVDRLAETLASPARGDVLVDAGRMRPGSAAWPLVQRAQATVLVTRPRLDELQHLPTRLRHLEATGRQPAVLLIGERPYPSSDVAAALNVPVLGVLPDDPRGAGAFGGSGARERWLRRAPLVRSSREIAPRLVALAHRPPQDHRREPVDPFKSPAEVSR